MRRNWIRLSMARPKNPSKSPAVNSGCAASGRSGVGLGGEGMVAFSVTERWFVKRIQKEKAEGKRQ